jgi:hypothetical protein
MMGSEVISNPRKKYSGELALHWVCHTWENGKTYIQPCKTTSIRIKSLVEMVYKCLGDFLWIAHDCKLFVRLIMLEQPPTSTRGFEGWRSEKSQVS